MPFEGTLCVLSMCSSTPWTWPNGEWKGRSSFLHPFWQEARQKGLVEGVCLACSTKMGTRELAEKEGLPLLNELKGHPSMGRFMAEGYRVLVM